MALQYYTDELLTENFNALSKFNGDVLEVLGGLTTLAERTDARLKALESIELIVRTPKRSKLFLLTVIGASAYAGYKYAEKEFKQSCLKANHHIQMSSNDKTDYTQPEN